MSIQSESLILSDAYSDEDLKRLADIIRNGKDFCIFAGFDFHETALKMLLDDGNADRVKADYAGDAHFNKSSRILRIPYK